MIKWSNEGKNSLWLFTKEEYHKLPDGIELTCIDKTIAVKVKGKDDIDMDTRFGHIAYGVRNPWDHKLKHLFLIFSLSQ